MESSDDEEVVGQPVAADAIWQPELGQTMEAVLGIVAMKRRMKPGETDAWVKAVRAKLEDIGIETVREYVTCVMEVNTLLKSGGHPCLHQITLKAIWHEVCEIVLGSEV